MTQTTECLLLSRIGTMMRWVGDKVVEVGGEMETERGAKVGAGAGLTGRMRRGGISRTWWKGGQRGEHAY